MDNDTLAKSSPIAWLLLNNAVTENQKPLEFDDHRFLIDLYEDMHHDIVVRKSAQVGESVERILKSLWCATNMDANIIYVLPTQNIVKDFVAPKVNPIIDSNPFIKELVQGKDSDSLKQIGNRFIYFRGAFSETEAIAISGDILILDELDRMPKAEIVNMYDSRLQASKLGYRWRLSNPSQVGYGVDALYNDSDQRHWFVQCRHCKFRSFIDFTPDTYADMTNHYIDQVLEIYACGKCGKELTDQDRRNGEWVVRYPSRDRHGYWISQMMAPWVSARRILEQKSESTLDFFHNFVLGKAYTPSDLIVNRETILRACAPSLIPKVNVVIGVDQNVSEQIWVAGTPQGIFAHGKAHSWEEIEKLKLMYNATVVCDPAPYPTMPKQLAKKYDDFYLCRFKAFDGFNSLEWKGKDVFVDRTRLLDTVANEITAAQLLFRESPNQLEDYIADWQNLYRTTEEKDDGRMKSVWKKKENKESDYSFATGYYRVGLSRMMGVSGMNEFAELLTSETQKADYVDEQGQLHTDIGSKVEEALVNDPTSKDWRYQ